MNKPKQPHKFVGVRLDAESYRVAQEEAEWRGWSVPHVLAYALEQHLGLEHDTVDRRIRKGKSVPTSTLQEQEMNLPTVYLQDADGNERTLQVTEPDPTDGTYCVHMDDEGQSWIRIVPQPEGK